MAFPPGFLEELRSRTSLARVAARKVSWDPRKTNPGQGDYWAPCPLHQEKTASFHVDDGKGFFHCFGCNEGGDAIDFIRATENASFIEAVEILATEAGLPMPEPDPKARAQAQAERALSDVMEEALKFYRLQLSGGRGRAARDYLAGRDVRTEIQQRFEIGYAPAGGKALNEALSAKGIAPAQMAEAGLIVPLDSGRPPYDRFRDRIIFPIRDTRGRAIAFGARALDPGETAKYLNSPQTPLFHKGRTLFNHAPARAAGKKAGTIVVAEGYMDVIALAQAGIDHAVAPLGTAITEDQLQLLWQMADEPVIALDGDMAGQRAAQKLIELALPHLTPGKSLQFAVLPPGQDPDDLIRAGGRNAMESLLRTAQPMIELVWQRQLAEHELDTPERRAGFDAALRSALGRIANEAVRRHYELEFRRRRSELFVPQRRNASREGGPRGWRSAPAGASPSARASLLARADFDSRSAARLRESAILLGCLNHPSTALELEALLERVAFLCPDLDTLRGAILQELPLAARAEEPSASLRAAIDALGHGQAVARLTELPLLRLNPHLQASADAKTARRAIEEELHKSLAESGFELEIAEAGEAIEQDSGGQLRWRLSEATEERSSARRGQRESGDSATVENDSLSDYFQDLSTREVWVKKRR